MTTQHASSALFQGLIYIVEEIVGDEVFLSDQDGGEITAPIGSVDFL